MATQYSNKPIVTDGLVYALDFGNQKSYVSGSLSVNNLTYSTVTSSIIIDGNLPIPPLVNQFLEFNWSGSSEFGIYIQRPGMFSNLTYVNGEYTICTVYNVKGAGKFFSQHNGQRFASDVSTTNLTQRFDSVGVVGRTYTRNMTQTQHVTYRYRSGSYDLFINGIPITASGINPSSADTQTDGFFWISGRQTNGNNYFTGSLGNFYLYNRALSSDEIWDNYQLSAPRYGLGPVQNKPYNLDENAYLFLQSAGITDPIITSSINTFVRGLKSNNLWDKMIAIYPFVGTGSTGINLTSSHRWNLKEPSLVTYPLTFTGSWVGSTSGSAPSGSGTNITMGGVTPTTVYPNLSTSSVHISILSYDTPVSSSYLMGTGMTEDLAVSTLAGDYGTPAAAYSVRKVRTAYSGALMDVRRSIDNITSSIGYVSNGDLDTGSLLDWVSPGRSTLPGAYSGLAAAYSLRRVSGSYSGPAVRVRGTLESNFRDIGFDSNGNLDTGSLLYFTSTGSNTLAGNYSGLAAAYSLRKVVSTYAGSAIEVRSGSVSQSIGFDSLGNLDIGSLLTFVGSGNGFVKTWYDQSGNNRHATQSLDAQQPQIVTNGTLVTQSGRPALNFNGSYDFSTTPFPLSSTDGLLLISVDKPSVATANKIYTYDTTAGQYWNTGGLLFSQQEFRVDGPGKINLTVTTESLDYKVRTYYATSTNAFMSINGRTVASASYSSFSIPSPVNAFIGRASGGGAERYQGLLQELVFYSASQANNKNYIESNINAYYNVFTTSSTSTENAFVNTWYDQSGNGRHATQTTSSRQPLIVSSGSLVTENGKPALRFDGVDDSLTMAGLHGYSLLDQYFVASTSDTNYGYPNGNPFSQHGFVATSGAPDTDITSQYGTPSLYANGTLFTGNTRGQIYTFLTGSKVIVHQGANVSNWSQYNFSNLSVYEYSGSLQELIAYTSSQAANRPLIENNINNYYNIYTGSNHGFVTRWYDQSGNNRHASQSVASSQPLIVLSGSLAIENNKPALIFDGVNDTFQTPDITLQTYIQLYTVVRQGDVSKPFFIEHGPTSNISNGFYIYGSDNQASQIRRGPDLLGDRDIIPGVSGWAGTNQILSSLVYNTSERALYKNNVLEGTFTRATILANSNLTDKLNIFSRNSTTSYSSGSLQELILYNANSSTREPIEYGINSYYNIYPQTSSFATSSFTIKADSGSISASLNNRLTSGIASSGPLGLITVSRTGSNSLTIARNGVTSSFAVPASGALSTEIYLGAINNNGIAVGNSPVNISFASVGTGLTGNDLIRYNGLVSELQGNLNTDTDATTFIQAAGLTGSYLDSTKIPAAVTFLTQNLKRYGLWTKMRAIYPFVGNNQNSQKINLKNPSLYTLSYGSGYTFSTQNGSVPGATITGFSMGVDAAAILSPNSGSIGFYTPTNVVRNGWTFGNGQFSLTIVLYAESGLTYYAYSDLAAVFRTQQRGFYAMSKTGSFVEGFYNSSRVYSGNQSTGSINGTMVFGSGQGTTSDAAFTFAYVSDSLTISDVQNLYSVVQSYQTILGRQV